MKKMKDSGIEWIGQIPEDWELTTYRRVFNRRKEYDDKDKQVLSLTIQGVKEKNESYGKMAEDFTGHQIVKKNDLVFTPRDFDATPILSGIAPCDGCISNLYFVLYPHDTSKTYIPFYNYFMWGVKWGGDIWRKLSYGMRFSYNFQQFGALPTVIPPMDIQKHIADFLDEKCGKIDRYIEKQQQVIEKLKAYKQSVITEAVTKGLDPNVPMKDSGIEWIGMIPEHWEIPEIKYLVRIASGGTPDRNHPEYWNGNIPWIKTGELQNDIIISAEEYITDEGLNNSSAQIFDVDTILVAMYGQGKTRGMTGLLKIPASTNQACAGLTVTNPSIHIQYLWQCLIGAYDAIRAEAAGSGQPNLSATLIGNFHVALPPIEEQDKIVDHIKNRTAEISSAIEKADSLLNKLIEYKKSLIYEAVTGKMEV
jgi:type I restriction enzyme S subunit